MKALAMARCSIEGAATPRSATRRVVVNAVLFEVGWFACVIGAGRGHPWLGAAAAFAVVAYHVFSSATRSGELRVLGCALAIGVLWDGLLGATGVVAYAPHFTASLVAPAWILAMWALFATTLNASLGWLRQRLLLASVLGAVSGPLSYLAGARFGALSFPDTALALVTLALGWALLVPALLGIARAQDGASLR